MNPTAPNHVQIGTRSAHTVACLLRAFRNRQPQPIPRLNRPLELRLESDDARRDAEEIRLRKPIHDRQAINKPRQCPTLNGCSLSRNSAWMGVSRKHRGIGVAEAGMPGAKLTELVCKCMRKLFTLHRKLLKGDQEYQGRKRDPLHGNRPAGAPDSEPETEPEVD